MHEPIILSLDTAGPVLGCVVSNKDQVRSFNFEDTKQEHCKNITYVVEQTLHKENIDLKDCDAFGCVLGPGSFTGLRIGLTMMKTFSHLFQKPLLGITSFEKMIADHHDPKALYLWPAQKNHAYGWARDMDKIRFETTDTLQNLSHPVLYHPYWMELKGPRSVSLPFDAFCARRMAECFYYHWVEKRFLDPIKTEPLYVQKVAAKTYARRNT